MKKLFTFLALVLGVVSCQTEPEGFDVNVGGEQDVNITVSLPEGTRADSALGAFGNVNFDEYDVRFQCEVHYGTEKKVLPVQISDNGKEATFPVRLIANRDYKFVVWADLVEQGKKTDLHYITTNGLDQIEINDWKAMDETRDAFTCSETRRFERGNAITLELTRPFAKLRVITTDMLELMGIVPTSAVVTYSTKHYEGFNALEQEPFEKSKNKTHEFTIAAYDYEDGDAEKTLFTDYFFAKEGDIVNFTMDVKDQSEVIIDETKVFNTPIPVNRNYVTTIKGNILTYADDFTVEIKDAFDNAGNLEDIPYYYAAVTNGADLLNAIREGREIIALNNITVTAADANFKEGTTRAVEAINAVINLNGFTITIDNNNSDALVDLKGGALTVEGNGAIKSTAGALVEGDVVVTEGATVEAEVGNVIAGVDALAYVLEKGGEFTFTENLAISEVLLASTTNPVVINGADFTLTSSASRAIRATVANANIVVNDLNIDVTTERVGSNDIRGISVDNVTGVELTLNNCSVIFSHPSGNDWAYAVNVTGGSNHKVTVNGGTYNGANVINVRGEKQTVIVKNATLTSLYPNNDVYYGACIYVVQNENSSVYAEGNTFNGDNALAFNIGYTPIEEKNNTDNAKRVAAKVNGAYYYNIAEAIAAAEDGATVKVLQSHDCNVGATVPAGKTLTLDLNGKTVNGTDTITASFGLITNKGNLTITGNGKMTLKAENNRGWNAYSSVISNTVGGKLVVENGTIEHLGGTDMAYGIDNLTNGKGTYAETVINGGTIKSTYRAVRMFLNGIEAQNLLTVNGGTIEGANKSIWMQDPSKNANTGTLVVNEGATLNGDVYLFVTAGSTEWPVEVSIAASAVNGEVLTGNVPENYVVENTNGVWTVKPKALADFEAAIAQGGNVTLSADITLLESVVIEGKNVVLDLNGKTVTAPLFSAFEVKNGAELTIKNGKVVAYESTVRAIGGKAIIESGEYTSTGTAADSPATYRYSLDCREGGELIINGGTFKSNNGMINVGSTVTINGGKFENVVEKTLTRHFAYVSAPLTINDGEFYGKANSSAGGCFFCGAAAGGDIQVNGGKFTSLWTSGSVNRIFEVYFGGTINVTGGMFNTNGGIATFVTENTDEATKAAYPYVAK